MKKTIQYPNSPLREVCFEIKFPGDPAIECHRDKYFKKIRNDFPEVLVPRIGEGSFLGLVPYIFQSSDSKREIKNAINQFCYSDKDYPGFSPFSQKAEKCVKEFCNCFKINKIHRIGLRYVNSIPFFREEGQIPLSRFLNLALLYGGDPLNHFTQINLAFQLQIGGGFLTTRVVNVQGDAGENLILDFDFFQTGTFSPQEIPKFLKTSHLETKRVFDRLISQEYLDFMKGKSL